MFQASVQNNRVNSITGRPALWVGRLVMTALKAPREILDKIDERIEQVEEDPKFKEVKFTSEYKLRPKMQKADEVKEEAKTEKKEGEEQVTPEPRPANAFDRHAAKLKQDPSAAAEETADSPLGGHVFRDMVSSFTKRASKLRDAAVEATTSEAPVASTGEETAVTSDQNEVMVVGETTKVLSGEELVQAAERLQKAASGKASGKGGR